MDLTDPLRQSTDGWDFEAVGRFIAFFNLVELGTHLLVWEWLDASPARSTATTARMQFTDLVDLLQRLAEADGLDMRRTRRAAGPHEDTDHDLEYQTAVFLEQLRELNGIRNAVVHGVTTAPGLEWLRKSRRTGRFEELPPTVGIDEALVKLIALGGQAQHVFRLLRAERHRSEAER